MKLSVDDSASRQKLLRKSSELQSSKENRIDFCFYLISGMRNGKSHCKLFTDRKRKFMTEENVFDLFMLVPGDLAENTE